jgi:hypothetical protein
MIRIAAFCFTLLFATTAFAGDVCLLDSANQAGFVLKRLRVPKQGGAATPVTGVGLTATSANLLPLSGTLLRESDDTLLLGLTRHFQRCLIGFVLDETLNGTVSYDCNLDNVNDTTASVTRVACDTF